MINLHVRPHQDHVLQPNLLQACCYYSAIHAASKRIILWRGAKAKPTAQGSVGVSGVCRYPGVGMAFSTHACEVYIGEALGWAGSDCEHIA